MSVTIVEPPPEDYYSTYLNPRVKDIESLSERIAMSLGYPQINVEAHTKQVYDNIAQACELFTKFAGYTEEYLIFHSSLYEQHKGLHMPKLFNHTPGLSANVVNEDVSYNTTPVHTQQINILNEDRPIYSFTASSAEATPVEFLLQFKGDYYHHATKFLITAIYNDITDEVDASVAEYGTTYNGDTKHVTFNVVTGGDTVEIVINSAVQGIATVTVNDNATPKTTQLTSYSRAVDDLLNSYRKVIDVFTFEEGTTSGINTLFTIEQTLAQQTYFSYAMGKYGFDLVSWYVLKEWLSMREKLLTQKFHWRFNEREQRLYITPEPVRENNRAEFYAAVGCYVEKPLRDVLKEVWVYQYALALTKITIGRIRGKYQGTDLFGGGSPNFQDLLQEGLSEKESLESALTDNIAPGFGDAAPPMFFVG